MNRTVGIGLVVSAFISLAAGLGFIVSGYVLVPSRRSPWDMSVGFTQ